MKGDDTIDHTKTLASSLVTACVIDRECVEVAGRIIAGYVASETARPPPSLRSAPPPPSLRSAPPLAPLPRYHSYN